MIGGFVISCGAKTDAVVVMRHSGRLERQASEAAPKESLRALDGEIHQGQAREDGSTPPVDLTIPVFEIRNIGKWKISLKSVKIGDALTWSSSFYQ
jgi:hypothetical protein